MRPNALPSKLSLTLVGLMTVIFCLLAWLVYTAPASRAVQLSFLVVLSGLYAGYLRTIPLRSARAQLKSDDRRIAKAAAASPSSSEPSASRPSKSLINVNYPLVASIWIACMLAAAFLAPNISSSLKITPRQLDSETPAIIRRMIATILVYSMQFGFIAFEAGSVRQSYRRLSVIKNLIVFSVAFISYILFGWQVQHLLNPLTTLADVAFNAGFAATVALIVANTITERATLLINALCSAVAAGVAYPLMAGLAFAGGPLARNLGFVDTAGGAVVHILGAAFGVVAALWVGPRSKTRAWALLEVRRSDRSDDTPWKVMGAFFLWFGWLGFNCGSADSWSVFLLAFTNTIIGACAGGLVGLLLAVAKIGSSPIAPDRFSPHTVFEELLGLERVVIGMLGGLVAVTANASLVKPSQALIEATLGALAAMVGSVLIDRIAEGRADSFVTVDRRLMFGLDDPLGAVSVHGLAGITGVVLTAVFVNQVPSHSLLWRVLVQLFGSCIAVTIGGSLAYLPCQLLWWLEHRRLGSERWLSGRLLHLTPYEQHTGMTGIRATPGADFDAARVRLRSGLPNLSGSSGTDYLWISDVKLMAMSERPNSELSELFEAIDTVLRDSYKGTPEEQTAVAALAARADVTRLPMCVERIKLHRGEMALEGVDVQPWGQLQTRYAETLIITVSELAESFASSVSDLNEQLPPDEVASIRSSIDDAVRLLSIIAGEDERLSPIAIEELAGRHLSKKVA